MDDTSSADKQLPPMPEHWQPGEDAMIVHGGEILTYLWPSEMEALKRWLGGGAIQAADRR